jgi:Na+/H+ antiporter NhaD/arsenite permease-like protein
MVICIAISANLQGAATLVGDTTSILLGGHANMNFLDFFFFKGKPSIFWSVEAGAVVSALVLLFLFRNENQKISTMEKTEVKDYFPTVLLVGIIVLLILASFIPNKPGITNGLICMSLFVVGTIKKIIQTSEAGATIKEAIGGLDFTTILLLAGLFVVIAGITKAGVITLISNLFVKVAGDNVFLIFTLITWASVLFSAFIDNIPYVATMLPVTTEIALQMGIDPYLLYFGLLTGATLGGNITPIGASANITGIGILRKEGHEVSVKEFMKYSVPFTISATMTGYLLIWFIWS